MRSVLSFFVGGFLTFAQLGIADEVLLEDSFENGLSDKCQVWGLSPDKYQVRDGGFGLRVQAEKLSEVEPMLRVDLLFSISHTVIASVEVNISGERPEHGEFAGLASTHNDRDRFRVGTMTINGCFVFAPGEPKIVGKSGEEEDPGKYTAKYWAAEKSAVPMRIIVKVDCYHFQVGPSTEGRHQTCFRSAIEERIEGMGFAIVTVGSTDEKSRWVRFDNFRVTKPC